MTDGKITPEEERPPAVEANPLDDAEYMARVLNDYRLYHKHKAELYERAARGTAPAPAPVEMPVPEPTAGGKPPTATETVNLSNPASYRRHRDRLIAESEEARLRGKR